VAIFAITSLINHLALRKWHESALAGAMSRTFWRCPTATAG
jgi:hypothetical protein